LIPAIEREEPTMAKIGQNNTNPDLAQTEELAKNLAMQIEAEKDHRKVEYVGVVYKDGDELKTTRLFSTGSYNSAPLDQAIAAAGGKGNVLAVVHNHTQKNVDMQFDKSTAQAMEQLPSSRPNDEKNPADWDAAQMAFGDRTDVAYYLLDPKDKLRRYDYADREHWIDEVRPANAFESGHGGKTYHPAPVMDMQPSLKPAEPSTTPASTPALADAAPSLSDPRAARLQTQSHEAVAQMEAGLGVAWNGNSERVAACVGRLAYQHGFDDIVAVAPNRATADHAAGELICVQGRSSSPDPYANRAIVATAEAMATPVEESQRVTQALQNETARQSQAEPSQQASMSR
jgi:hypothetical protein